MNWTHFPWFAAAASLLWLAGAFAPARTHRLLVLAGTGLIAVFAAGLWIALERPPLRTLGETRLWFAILLPAAGCVIHWFVPWRWPLIYSCGMATLFLGITWHKPDTWDQTLMPALQSIWFVPHVVLYMIAYAFLVASALLAASGWWKARHLPASAAANLLPPAEAAIWIGFAFLTLGLLAGAVWAKEAWGHYWTWDPKETWAFLTWAVYLGYFHLQSYWRHQPRHALLYLTLACLLVFMCWFGVNALPSASQSVHTYTD